MKRIGILLSVFISLIMLMTSVSGVFATWYMAEQPAVSVQQSQDIFISEFVWAPDEILPSVTPGQNYLDLHQSILENVKGGLNSSKDTLENAVLKDKDGLLHSSQNVQGGNLSHLFVTQESRELDFVVEYVSDNEFLVYMYKSADADNGAAGVTKIQVYKTIYTKENNEWYGKETQLGMATVQYFPSTSVLSIDVKTWSR